MENIDLRGEYLVPPDQKDSKKCAVYAVFSVLGYLLSSANTTFSTNYTYYTAKKLEGTEDLNCGVRIGSVVKAVKHYGVVSYDEWPDNIDKTAKEIAVLEKTSTKLSNLEQVYLEQTSLEDIYTALERGLLFVFGLSITESFSAANINRGIVPPPIQKQLNYCAGHAMLGVGLSSIEGKWHVITQNSRGVDWGDKGYCYIPWSYVANTFTTTEFCTIQFKSVLPL